MKFCQLLITDHCSLGCKHCPYASSFGHDYLPIFRSKEFENIVSTSLPEESLWNRVLSLCGLISFLQQRFYSVLPQQGMYPLEYGQKD